MSIPFANKVGIVKADDGRPTLVHDETLHNHVQTIAASAQFTLAEIASGEYLGQAFPELVDKVIPLLRDAQIKFKKPVTETIKAYPTITEAALEKFNAQFERKGRGTIAVDVEVKDIHGTVSCAGTFNWYVQKI